MEGTSTTSKTRHQPVAPSTSRRACRGSAGAGGSSKGARAKAPRPVAPETCGAVHPERPGIVAEVPLPDGTVALQQLTDPVVCTGWAATDPETGERKIHAGKHRARVLAGQLERWDVDTAPQRQQRSMADLLRSARKAMSR